MCDHRDANRTLSQLSYKPEYEVVCLVDEFARWVLTTLPKFSATPVAKILAARFFAGQGCNMSGLLSQLSYKPVFTCTLLLYTFSGKMQEEFLRPRRH